jgi:hypothetical protein
LDYFVDKAIDLIEQLETADENSRIGLSLRQQLAEAEPREVFDFLAERVNATSQQWKNMSENLSV